MDRQQAEWLLQNFKIPIVKQHPRSRPGHSVWQKCRLISIKNDRVAVVLPWGHKHNEEVQLADLVKWNSWCPGDPPALQTIEDQPQHVAAESLTVKIGDIMQSTHKGHARIGVLAKNNAEWIPGMRKHDDAKWAEAAKLRDMGKTYADIAKITGIPLGTIASRMCRAREKPVNTKRVVETKPKAQAAAAPVANPAQSDDKIVSIQQILTMKVSDKSKLLMIEGLVSHA